MTFPLEFDLLMIGVCTFKKKKKDKKKKGKKRKKKKQKQKKKKKKRKKENKKKTKKKKKKRKKKVQRHVYVSYLTLLGFCCWVHHWGFGSDFYEI